MRELQPGDLVNVVTDGWAGRLRHAVRVQKDCPVRVKVLWLDQRDWRYGKSTYVPRTAIEWKAEPCSDVSSPDSRS